MPLNRYFKPLFPFYLKFLIVVILFYDTGFAQPKRFSFTRPEMGSYFTIIFYDQDSLSAEAHANSCFAIVDSLNAIYSDYISGSELNKLSLSAGKDTWIQVSPALFDIVAASRKAWLLSDGAFDITVGSLVKLWRKARKNNQLPSADSIRACLKATGFRYILMDKSKLRIKLRQSKMQLDLGGIGQGYMAQKVIDYLNSEKITSALVDASGDIVTSASPPGTKGWKIAINMPASAIELQNRFILVHDKAVITSGDVFQHLNHKGKQYSHIINPGTGYGVTNQRNVTIIASSGITADWLATAGTILPISKTKRLAMALHAEFLVGTLKQGHVIFTKSKNFEKFRQPADSF